MIVTSPHVSRRSQLSLYSVPLSHWQDAIALMDIVPLSHPQHSLAQQKIAEYQENLNYAQKNSTIGQ